MQIPETPSDQPQAVPLQPGQETVIKFVLNGPIFAESMAGVEAAHGAAPADVADLRRRVAVLERALVDAETQLQALGRAIGAVFPASANFVDSGAARHVPAPPAGAIDGAWTMGALADHSFATPASLDSGGTLAAAAAAASFRYREPESQPLQVVAPPEPPPAPSAPPPKVTGLRRMISVLKHS